MGILLQLLVIVSLSVITMGARIRRSEPFSINLNLTKTNNDKPTRCTINNRTGVRVHESACNEEHMLWEGGRVLREYDFRDRNVKQCPIGYWCCSYNGTIPDIHTTDSQMTEEPKTYIKSFS